MGVKLDIPHQERSQMVFENRVLRRMLDRGEQDTEENIWTVENKILRRIFGPLRIGY
jgi:hypothetical protein